MVDFVVGRCQTAVADKECPRQFLVEFAAHFGLNPRNDIEIGDIDNVVAIDGLFLIHGRRVGRTLKQREYLVDFLFAFRVTFCSCFVCRNIRESGFDARERRTMYRSHNLSYPRLVSVDHYGGRRYVFIVGEQILDFLYSVLQRRFLQTAVSLPIVDDFHLLGMTKYIAAGNSFVVFEHVVFHVVFVSLIFIVFFVGFVFFQCLPDERIHYIFLFFGHRIDNLLNGLTFLLIFHFGFFSFFFIRFGTGRRRFCFFFFGLFIGMIQFDFFSRKDNSRIFGFFSVINHVVYKCTRIRSCQNKTYFTNDSMKNRRAVLFKFIGEYGQRSYVPMFYQQFCFLSSGCVVKHTVSINSVVSIFQNGMSQYVVGIVMLMIPNKRNRLSVLFFESILHNHPAIGTFEICFCCPTAEIIILFHFELFLRRIDCCVCRRCLICGAARRAKVFIP